MKFYTKKFKASKINKVDKNNERVFYDENKHVTGISFYEYAPRPGDYLVIAEDGSRQLVPGAIFDQYYTETQEK